MRFASRHRQPVSVLTLLLLLLWQAECWTVRPESRSVFIDPSNAGIHWRQSKTATTISSAASSGHSNRHHHRHRNRNRNNRQLLVLLLWVNDVGGSSGPANRTSAAGNQILQEEEEEEAPSSEFLVLEDSLGRVNRDLAERIWHWEQEHRAASQLPPLEYSMRAGLRLVSQLAQKFTLLRRSSRKRRKIHPGVVVVDDDDENSDDDLVQEGLMALLDALSHFPGSEIAAFEQFATQRIEQSLVVASTPTTFSRDQQQSRRPDESSSRRVAIRETKVQSTTPSSTWSRLPRSVRSTLQHAQRVVVAQQQNGAHNNGTEVLTLAHVAHELMMPVERLRDYIRLAMSTTLGRGTHHRHGDKRRQTRRRPQPILSVEQTVVGTSNPQLQDAVEYRDQEEWELWQGWLLDNGRTIVHEELVEQFVDGMIQHEGDDESWLRRQQNGGRLHDLIPDLDAVRAIENDDEDEEDARGDDNADNDDARKSVEEWAFEELIRSNLSSFLHDTLTDQEQQVIRLAFGLTDSGAPPASQSRIAANLQVEKEDVSRILTGALDKLRASYQSKYLEPDTDEDEFTIDSV